MALPLVYVLTLNWNRRQDTLACLESMMRMSYPHFRILVVDNGSTDGSAEAIVARFPEVEIIANERNLGFAAGCNVGLCHVLAQGAEYVFVVNNDTIVGPPRPWMNYWPRLPLRTWGCWLPRSTTTTIRPTSGQ